MNHTLVHVVRPNGYDNNRFSGDDMFTIYELCSFEVLRFNIRRYVGNYIVLERK